MPTNTRKLKVLLVDGSSSLNYYSRFLVSLDCEVVTATDFTTATNQLRASEDEDHNIKVVFVNDRIFAGRSEIDAELISMIRAGWPDKEIVAITVDEMVMTLQETVKIDYVIARGPGTSNLAGFRRALEALSYLDP